MKCFLLISFIFDVSYAFFVYTIVFYRIWQKMRCRHSFPVSLFSLDDKVAGYCELDQTIIVFGRSFERQLDRKRKPCSSYTTCLYTYSSIVRINVLHSTISNLGLATNVLSRRSRRQFCIRKLTRLLGHQGTVCYIVS